MKRSIVFGMKGVRSIGVSLAVLCAIVPAFAAAAVSQISIGQDGSFSGTNLTIFQKAGTNLFTRATWGQAFLRLVILSNASTNITKDHGGVATIADLAEQDVISVNGTLATGADSIVVNASSIQDTTLQNESRTVAGFITSIDPNAHTFSLSDKTLGNIAIAVSSSTSMLKGSRYISFSELSVGDKILSSAGAFDFVSRTLAASEVEVYQDPTVFAPRNFEGKLLSISTTTLSVLSGGTTYTVYLSQNGTILSKNRTTASLGRFVAGDTVRLWGAMRKTNLTEIDANIVRDLNF